MLTALEHPVEGDVENLSNGLKLCNTELLVLIGTPEQISQKTHHKKYVYFLNRMATVEMNAMIMI